MKVLARGLNFMGQLGIENGNQNIAKFQEITQLTNKNVKQLEAHFTQSYCRLEDGQILHWGYIFDSLTTTRVLNYYKKAPKFARQWQKYSCFGKTLGLRLGSDKLGLLNGDQVLKVNPKKISVGGSFLHYITNDGIVYGMGENYKGQLGTGNTKFKFGFESIQFHSNDKIVDISNGFQHSIFLTDSGQLYGCGRANWNQIVPLLKDDSNQKSNAFIDFFQNPSRMIIPNEKVVKISTGFHHSIFLCLSGNLYSLGFNNHGQCGTSNFNRVDCDEFQRVYLDLEDNEKIVEIASGKSHNLFYTNFGNVFMFGNVKHFQMARYPDFDIDMCSPVKVELPFKEGEKPIKIKANFDRSAVITNLGNCFVWGGEDLENLSGEKYTIIENVKESIIQEQDLNQNNSGETDLEYNNDTFVTDIALGYMHTLVKVQQKGQQSVNNTQEKIQQQNIKKQ